VAQVQTAENRKFGYLSRSSHVCLAVVFAALAFTLISTSAPAGEWFVGMGMMIVAVVIFAISEWVHPL